MSRPLLTKEALERAPVQPRARYWLFGVTRKDVERAKKRLIAALEAQGGHDATPRTGDAG